jgi:hypothetical protein
MLRLISLLNLVDSRPSLHVELWNPFETKWPPMQGATPPHAGPRRGRRRRARARAGTGPAVGR